ncbi:MAG: type II toxin-antitoxin system RelE/ParE family toxin [Saprospiraceae bacterium]|nr:type II toxin-antitoxin system RelE/ParE family toxin [Saprospiraceae bacterium]MBK8482982.1 type II toxin-antitoxin system RelE/ParE family toxin [Saprospiraceae bacterium]MBK9722663.1 type II toxin-antitoxin system RelE/ParE family toxin [Saprospiraceae bacterium]MBK9726565.1 type II toxin-antitoxin system RelE/ParE family toxin [Saprospiraceae bacterium]
MVKKQVIWTETSIKELEIILQFYIQRNKNINFSSWLLDEIEKRIEIISIYPKIGRETDFSVLRILPFNNYGIIYKETDENIFIESIWDFRQNPMKRLDKK